MKRKFYQHTMAVMLAMIALGLQSCLKDQTDIFDRSSSQRLQAYLDQTKAILVSAPNGWQIDMYPVENQSIGGHAFTVKFDNEKCEVRSVIEPSRADVSYYNMTSEVGPAISFDTYNALLHYFSDPSSQRPMAFRGDFEFVIDSLSDNLIKVHGSRTKNVMYFRRLEEPAKDYIERVAAFKTAFTQKELWSFKASENGTEYEAEINPLAQQITVTSGGKKTTTAIAFTDKGVRTYKPITLGNATFNELVFDAQNQNYQAKLNNSDAASYKAVQPAWMPAFHSYEGNFTLYAKHLQNGVEYDAEIDVEMKPMSDYSGYEMDGLIRDYKVKAVFDREKRVLGFLPQFIMRLENNLTLAMFSYNKTTRHFGTDKQQINLVWDEASQKFLFKDAKMWNEPVTGWLMVVFTPQREVYNAKVVPAASQYLFGRAYDKLDELISMEKQN